MHETPKNSISFEVWGKYALFTDPLSRVGGEKCSYHIPTYEAVKGITESIYWKPSFIWIVDKVRIMAPIRTEAKNMKPVNLSGGNTLATYTYLADVRYQVLAHFEWNPHREDLRADRIEGKHWDIAKRMLEKGGRRDIFIGTRECQGYVEACEFGSCDSDHHQAGELTYGLMFHGFDYPDTIGKDELHARFWSAKVNAQGIIEFPRPDDPSLIRRFVREMTSNPPKSVGLDEPQHKLA
ncbi:CRISPR-associated protein Cas5d [Haloferula luteola]|uniref:pre-crRNA processing endonuclease n=1 Tax=Haloferula luteola TaxID=595692 RepID=A0A840V9D9_9BACT|nr:type I-C CRISPR-associated protein Cas5c [Haloferula luteola]MBB5353686.1 CRISPR-associated protein Cas5d [Haloferula luteola]